MSSGLGGTPGARRVGLLEPLAAVRLGEKGAVVGKDVYGGRVEVFDAKALLVNTEEDDEPYYVGVVFLPAVVFGFHMDWKDNAAFLGEWASPGWRPISILRQLALAACLEQISDEGLAWEGKKEDEWVTELMPRLKDLVEMEALPLFNP